jgi:hypothetical protein
MCGQEHTAALTIYAFPAKKIKGTDEMFPFRDLKFPVELEISVSGIGSSKLTSSTEPRIQISQHTPVSHFQPTKQFSPDNTKA